MNMAAATPVLATATAARWRHRLLQLVQPVKAPKLADVVEAHEALFVRSSKGQRLGCKPRWPLKYGGRASRKDRGTELNSILVARDRSGATADVPSLDAVSKACLSQALNPRVHGDAMLCTDGSAALAAAAQDMGVRHEACNRSAGQRVRGPWHIQNANAYHAGLKTWIARFRGVATDYLQSYLGWLHALEHASKRRMNSAPMPALALGQGGYHGLTLK